MNKDVLNKTIENLVKMRCQIELVYDDNLGLGFDLCTGMKSECIIYVKEDKVVFKKRYNTEEFFYPDTPEEMEELIFDQVKTCMCHRDYASWFWFWYAGKHDVDLENLD